MTTYKGIKGFTIQTIAGDPSDPILGQVWYNTTSNVLKGYASVAGAWASSPSTNTKRDAAASAGTQTAALYFCGRLPGASKACESFNGTAWTNVNSCNTGREYLGGAGIQTAALAIGAIDQSPNLACETWNGTCWSEGNNVLNPHSGGNTSGGTTTAAITAGGGWPPPSGYAKATSETYNGASWTAGNELPSAQNGMQGGSSYASVPTGFAYGGSPANAVYVEYDGTCWTTGTSGNTPREQMTAAGSNTAALVWAGNPGHQTNTEQWNGSTWTEMADLAVGRRAASGAGTYTKALSIAGETPPGSYKNNTCEAWNEGPSVVTFTSS